MDYSKALFVPKNRDIIENLRYGQIFSLHGITFPVNIGGEYIFSVSDHVIYLGENTDPNSTWDSILFLVVLKNGDTLTWTISHRTIETFLDTGKFVKSKRTKTRRKSNKRKTNKRRSYRRKTKRRRI